MAGVPFARRASWDLTPNPLAAEQLRRQAAGQPSIDLTVSNPTRVGLDYAACWRDALAAALQPVYRAEPLGLGPARAAVSAYYADHGRRVAPEHVVLTASTSEAYAFAFKLLADPGDDILIPRPSYPLFEYLAALEGVSTRTYPLRYDDDTWSIDLDRVAAALGPRTRAIVLVQPNNPTGSYLAAAERRALESLAAECGLALIADEVFLDYPHEPATGGCGSLAGGAGVLTLTLSGLSKVLGLPQLKLSWMVAGGPAGPRAAALERLSLIADTYLSVNTGVQAALPRLLGARSVSQALIQERLRRNLTRLDALLASSRARQPMLQRLRCEGGWYAVLRCTTDAAELAHGLVRDAGVLVHPGYLYDFPREDHLVLSLLPPEREFAQGVVSLLRYVGG